MLHANNIEIIQSMTFLEVLSDKCDEQEADNDTEALLEAMMQG
jgi:hypothetical protein